MLGMAKIWNKAWQFFCHPRTAEQRANRNNVLGFILFPLVAMVAMFIYAFVK